MKQAKKMFKPRVYRWGVSITATSNVIDTLDGKTCKEIPFGRRYEGSRRYGGICISRNIPNIKVGTVWVTGDFNKTRATFIIGTEDDVIVSGSFYTVPFNRFVRRKYV